MGSRRKKLSPDNCIQSTVMYQSPFLKQFLCYVSMLFAYIGTKNDLSRFVTFCECYTLEVIATHRFVQLISNVYVLPIYGNECGQTYLSDLHV
jgi:hypothetical protein